MPLPELLIVSFSRIADDPRVRRQIDFLRDEARITVAGYGTLDLPGIRFVPLQPPVLNPTAERLRRYTLLFARRYEAFYRGLPQVRQAWETLKEAAPHVILANDIDALPLAVRLAERTDAGVFFDAHEYAPLEFEDRLGFRLTWKPFRTYLCRTYIPRVDAMTTVNRSLAERYEAETGVRPEIVTNAPPCRPLQPQPMADDGTIRLVHHGASLRSRYLEGMIRMMDRLPDPCSLTFYLTDHDPAYVRMLKKRAESRSRITFRDPVPMTELPETLNAYDIGVFLLRPVNFNYRYALPNKIFEHIQARLCLAVSPNPEMARIVRKYRCGVVGEDYTAPALAAAIAALTPEQIVHAKEGADAAARECNAEANAETVRTLFRKSLEAAGSHPPPDTHSRP